MLDSDIKEWPSPDPLYGELPPVEPFSLDLLPQRFRGLVKDASERMSVPPDFAAVIVVLGLSGCVNRRATIQPLMNDSSWIETPNLWGGIVSPPGTMKSPLIESVTSPVLAIQDDWKAEYEEEMKDYVKAQHKHDLRVRAYEQLFIAHIKKPGDNPEPTEPEDGPVKPVLKRIIINDSTSEKLHEILSENPSGVLMVCDELTGWLAALEKPGREDARAFFLSAWNGDGSHTTDRIGRGTLTAKLCISMLGGIQPARLRSYLSDALRDGPSNDGLIQRFQLLVYPDMAAWSEVDRQPDKSAARLVEHCFRNLVTIDPEEPARFTFSPAAQELFNAWRRELELKLRSGDEHPALIAHLSKFRGLMPSLALLFELADRSSASDSFQVSLEHAQQAAAWTDYLESHARRIYSCLTTPALLASRELGDRIKRGKLGVRFTARDVYRKCWSGLDTPEAVRPAIEMLAESGWIRPDRQATGYYLVNPAVHHE